MANSYWVLCERCMIQSRIHKYSWSMDWNILAPSIWGNYFKYWSFSHVWIVWHFVYSNQKIWIDWNTWLWQKSKLKLLKVMASQTFIALSLTCHDLSNNFGDTSNFCYHNGGVDNISPYWAEGNTLCCVLIMFFII